MTETPYPNAVYQLLKLLRDEHSNPLIRSLSASLQKAAKVAKYAKLVYESCIPETAPNYSPDAAGWRVNITDKGLATLAAHELRISEQQPSAEATLAANPPIPQVGHDLLAFLSEQPRNRCAIADLPKRFLNADVLTVMDADRLIEFGHRNHCCVGSNLVVEDGWDFVSITGPNKKPMVEYIAEALEFDDDVRIRQHVQPTAKGRVNASRLVLAEQPRIIEQKPGGINKDTFRCAFPTSCAEDAKRRGKGCRAWKIAKERGEDYIRNHPFPGLNELARRSGCNPHTLKRAICKSKDLTRAQATHELSKAPPTRKRGHKDDPAWQAQVDEALRMLIESAPKAKRAELNSPEMRTQLEKMEPDDLAKLVEDAEEQAKERQKAAQRARARTAST